ncbi:2-oxo acid dehydrogenase subunit E2 [Actinophytocola sp.]|jgi:2-oxoglutarate dehydrogenase E2 component (dihydrolipoamide succinyltransferase)|uniref:2-oxo acid dehydrogenase subunit E2 n=1 Tax=Actinophytocola sp. TaxID=1872138 RepID=UPI002EDA9F80
MAIPDDVTIVPHTTVRKRIARHMAASSATAAHVYAMIDVDYSAVDEVRRREAPRWREERGHSLTYLPFVARAVAIAIERYPNLNARFTDDGLELRREVGLGVAVDRNFEGLVVPVIQRAHQLAVPALATAIDDLAGRTREGRLRGEDVTGGTFTLSNPGPFGARTTLPIINQPQVAILTVDAIAPRPAVVPDGEGGHALAIRPIGNLTLAWDHRAFDGAYAASALASIRSALESPDWRAEFA